MPESNGRDKAFFDVIESAYVLADGSYDPAALGLAGALDKDFLRLIREVVNAQFDTPGSRFGGRIAAAERLRSLGYTTMFSGAVTGHWEEQLRMRRPNAI